MNAIVSCDAPVMLKCPDCPQSPEGDMYVIAVFRSVVSLETLNDHAAKHAAGHAT